MRKVFGLLTLTAVLACSAHAGVIPNGDGPPPPPAASSLTNDEAPTSTVYPTEDDLALADSAADITIMLVSGVLSLF